MLYFVKSRQKDNPEAVDNWIVSVNSLDELLDMFSDEHTELFYFSNDVERKLQENYQGITLLTTV